MSPQQPRSQGLSGFPGKVRDPGNEVGALNRNTIVFK